jgi:CheY-like chemotaxis protein
LFCVYRSPGTHQFASPAALFADIKKASPELIVLDLALGQSDAIEVIRHLEILGYKGKVQLISGRDQVTLREIQRIGEQHGLTMVRPVQKPFRGIDIRNALAVGAPAPAGSAGHARGPRKSDSDGSPQDQCRRSVGYLPVLK